MPVRAPVARLVVRPAVPVVVGLVVPAVLVGRPDLVARARQRVLVARRDRICRLAQAAETTHASLFRAPVCGPVGLAAVPVDLAVLGAAEDPVAAVLVPAVVRPVRSVNPRASDVVPLRSSLLPQ